jgi:hypothetical protein
MWALAPRKSACALLLEASDDDGRVLEQRVELASVEDEQGHGRCRGDRGVTPAAGCENRDLIEATSRPERRDLDAVHSDGCLAIDNDEELSLRAPRAPERAPGADVDGGRERLDAPKPLSAQVREARHVLEACR